MASHGCTKHNHRPRNTNARRRQMIGFGASAGAFLAFGLTPLAAPPPAHADDFGAILDAIISSSVGSLAAMDHSAALAGLDLGGSR